MINGISKEQHVYADYSYIPMVLLAPNLAGFNYDKFSANIVRSFAVPALAFSLLTDAEWGAVRVMPYKWHAALDIASGALAFTVAALPPVSGNKKAQKTLCIIGIVGLVVGTLSLIGALEK